MNRHALNEGWRLTAVGALDAVPQHLKDQLTGDGVSATTPGCVHTDLMGAGLIPDQRWSPNLGQPVGLLKVDALVHGYAAQVWRAVRI